MPSLVAKAKDALRPFKRKLNEVLPRRLRAASPVVQVFLGGAFQSRYTLVNFPSLYSPFAAHPCLYDVALYGADGQLIGRRSLRLERFGSAELHPESLFGPDLPEVGLFTARIRPASLFDFAYKHLGTVTSHFYALYQDRAGDSMVLVHPQTLVDAPRGENMNWCSGYLLDAARICTVDAVQVNPTSRPVDSTLYLLRSELSAPPLGECAGVIPAMGARRVSWSLRDLGLEQGLFSVAARGLPTNNAKPILFTHFSDGSFSGMHA